MLTSSELVPWEVIPQAPRNPEAGGLLIHENLDSASDPGPSICTGAHDSKNSHEPLNVVHMNMSLFFRKEADILSPNSKRILHKALFPGLF